MKTIFALLLVAASCSAAQPNHAKFLAALQQVESGGKLNPPAGDNGKAIGPFQIWREYFSDAKAANPKLGGNYASVKDARYARTVVESYLKRYAPQAWAKGDWETLAKIHNGGPTGPAKPATREYWAKVRAQMQKNS